MPVCDECAEHIPTDRQKPSDGKRNAIYSPLNSVGISAKLLGYDYLTEAIETYTEGQTSKICAHLAHRHGKSAASIERAMQHAINKAWSSAELETLLANYKAPISSAKGTPTVTEFVAYYAKKLCDNK